MLATATLAALLAAAGTVSAHGYVDSWTIGSQKYTGFNLTNAPWTPDQGTIGWPAWNDNTGPIYGNQVGSPDIICSINATNAMKYATPIAAGSTLQLHWTAWPASHKGPVVTYLAACNGECATADKKALRRFKIAEKGQISYGTAGTAGVWAADQLHEAGGTWAVTIPKLIKAGNYVLRHEIIALHSAFTAGAAAQLYPQCANIKVTGSGTATPSGVVGAARYKENDPGIHYDIYNDQKKPVYKIPGLALYTG